MSTQTVTPRSSQPGTAALETTDRANRPESPAVAPDSSRTPHRSRLPFWACTLLAAVLMFANYLGVLPIDLVASQFFPHPSEGASRVVNILGCLATLATALGLVALVSRWVLRGRLRDVGWIVSRDSGWLFGLGWLLATLVMGLTQLVCLVPGLPVEVVPVDPSWAALSGGTLLLVVLSKVAQAIALQGIPEELVWRGWLMNCLARRPRLALAVSVVVFGCLHILSNGGMHGIGAVTYPLQAMGFAFLAGALALRMRSLWCAIGVHAGMHLTTLALAFAPRHADGPLVWTMMAALYAVAALIVLRGWHGEAVRYER